MAEAAPQWTVSRSSSSILNSVANLVCSGMASGLIIGCLNPADTLRVRWQVGSSRNTGPSISKFARSIVVKEGFNRGLLQPGLWTHVLSVGLCSSMRFTAYPMIRDTLARLTTSSSRAAGEGVPAWTAVSASVLSGGLGYLTFAPLYLEKTRQQIESIQSSSSSSNRSELRGVSREAPPMRFLSALWHSDFRSTWGSAGTAILVVRGAALSVGQLAGYDLAKKALVAASLGDGKSKNHGGQQGEGTLIHVLASVHAAFWATSLALPLDVLLVRDQASVVAGNGSSSLSRAIQLVRDTVKTEGPGVFVRGWTPMFLRLSIFYSTSNAIFEEARRLAGLSYYG